MSRALKAHLAGRVQGTPAAISTQGSLLLPMESTPTTETPVGRRGHQNNAEFWHLGKWPSRVRPAPQPAGAPRTPVLQAGRDARGPAEHWHEAFPPISHPVPGTSAPRSFRGPDAERRGQGASTLGTWCAAPSSTAGLGSAGHEAPGAGGPIFERKSPLLDAVGAFSGGLARSGTQARPQLAGWLPGQRGRLNGTNYDDLCQLSPPHAPP